MRSRNLTVIEVRMIVAHVCWVFPFFEEGDDSFGAPWLSAKALHPAVSEDCQELAVMGWEAISGLFLRVQPPCLIWSASVLALAQQS